MLCKTNTLRLPLLNSRVDQIVRLGVLVCLFFVTLLHTLTAPLLIMAVLYYVGGNAKRKWLAWQQLWVHWVLLALVAWLFIAALWTPAGVHVGLSQAWHLSDKWFVWLLLAPLFQKPQWRRAAMYVFIAGCVFSGAKSLVEPITHIQSLSVTYAIAAVLCLFECLVSRRVGVRLGLLACFIFISGCLFFRVHELAGFLSYFILLYIFVTYALKRYRILLLIGVVLLGFGVYVFSPTIHLKVERLVTAVASLQSSAQLHTTGSTQLRLYSYRQAVQIIAHKPLLGWGYKSYGAAQVKLFPHAVYRMTWVENSFLFLAEKTGLIGMALLVLWVVMQFLTLAKLPHSIERTMAICVGIAFVVGLMTSPQFRIDGTTMRHMLLMLVLLGGLYSPESDWVSNKSE